MHFSRLGSSKSFLDLVTNSTEMKIENRYIRSTSFPLVLFLFAKGAQIAGVNQADDSDKKEFALVRIDRLEELIDKYKFGDRDDLDLQIPVHTYEQARRELLDVLKSH